MRDTHDIARMSQTIAHRGPDDAGFTLIGSETDNAPHDFCGVGSDREIIKILPRLPPRRPHRIAFAHLRYSVFDLSVRGHQPMWDVDRQVCVSFNGEIYNHVELRAELEAAGYRFVSTSDTEVLLHGFKYWGTGLFSRLNGPMALALYDAESDRVLLARDRLGKSPLYIARRSGRIFWASEIKAIRAVCGADAFEVRPQAIDDFLVLGLRDADGTFWEGIDDFPPAHWAIVPSAGPLEVTRYWDIPAQRLSAKEISQSDAIRELRNLLRDSLRLRLRADVPLSFELSGGLDSSSLVALAAADRDREIAAYSVCFNNPDADESAFATAVGEYYADTLKLSWFSQPENDFWDVADRFVHLQEEPFHSPNVYTLHCLRASMRAAGAKVIIAGSAGDEVLAGYAYDYTDPYLVYLFRHLNVTQLVRGIVHGEEFRGRLPYSVKRLAASMMRATLGGPPRTNVRSPVLRKAYVRSKGMIPRPASTIDFDEIWKTNMTWRRMNYWLRCGNKTAFGVPVETRAPFLDHRVVEFGSRLPPEYLIRDGWFKWILRKSVESILPQSVVWRRTKMGFPFPLSNWLLASEDRIGGLLGDLNCPWLSQDSLKEQYRIASKTEPVTLWRLVSLAMWWRQEIEHRTL